MWIFIVLFNKYNISSRPSSSSSLLLLFLILDEEDKEGEIKHDFVCGVGM